MAESPRSTNLSLYTPDNPLDLVPFDAKVDMLAKIDAFARSRDSKVVQVMASLSGSWQAVRILRAGGMDAGDIRPLVRLNVSVVVQDANGRRETGGHGMGGRVGYDGLLEEATWKGPCARPWWPWSLRTLRPVKCPLC
jgi:TldD protein